MRFSDEFKVIGKIRPHAYPDSVVRSDVETWIAELESMFGSATNDWAFGGVYFNACETEGPCLYYPYDYPGEVMVQLAGPALESKEFARFQLAHEMAHCLSPSGRTTAKVFEEGLAAWYQQRLSVKKLNHHVMLSDPRYVAARKLYLKLNKTDKDAIMKLRLIEPRMWKISNEAFSAAGLSVDDGLRNALLCPFENFTVPSAANGEVL